MTTPANAEAQRWHAIVAARQAHARKGESVDQYRQAIQHATSCGCTYTELAAALGITRQAIRQLTLTTR